MNSKHTTIGDAAGDRPVPRKLIQEIYAAYCLGDPLTDVELERDIAHFEPLSKLLLF